MVSVSNQRAVQVTGFSCPTIDQPVPEKDAERKGDPLDDDPGEEAEELELVGGSVHLKERKSINLIQIACQR